VEASPFTPELQATFTGGAKPALFLWRVPEGPESPARVAAVEPVSWGRPAREALVQPADWADGSAADPLMVARVTGRRVVLEECVPALAGLPLEGRTAARLSRSLAVWSSVAKLAVQLVAGQRVAPWVEEIDGELSARWRAVPGPRDRARLDALARALPRAACAWHGDTARGTPRLMPSGQAVRHFLDAAVDVLVRPHVTPPAGRSWTARLAAALAPGTATVTTTATVEQALPKRLRRWVAPGVGEAAEAPVRLALRLELPEGAGDGRWSLALVAEAAADPSLRVAAVDLWEGTTAAASEVLALAPDVAEALLLEVDRACRLWPALEPCLDQPAPSGIFLSAAEVVELVTRAAPLLNSAGIALHVPPELSITGRQRLRARLRGRSQSSGEANDPSVRFGLAQVLSVQWEAALGDEPISLEELRRLAEAKQSLVRWRDQWIVVDPAELTSMIKLLEQPPAILEGAAALRAVLSGEARGPGGQRAELALDRGDGLLQVLEELRSAATRRTGEISGLHGTLRPYQETGAAWLDQLGRLGLGACLADDMGLGKTVQVIAHLLLRRLREQPQEPSLLVCPTSVLGNWERELARFAPEIPVRLHHGPARAPSAAQLTAATGKGGVVLTTYGVLRSDAAKLVSIAWDMAVLDEAQFIKNHQSKVAAAARKLRARQRIALTGTPVENRLTDLWSIFAFITPGFLGGISQFKKQIATPVERFRDPGALEQLQRLTSPFILRRTKDDPKIAPELPPRIVLGSACTLTREQASLYQASLNAAMEEIEGSEAMDRRGKVLALITSLKQICNHPAQFLRERDASPERSGKLQHLARELETILAEGDAALLFTQYRTMGDILVRFLEQRLAITAPFLHGGVRRSERERMVARFQAGEGPPLMVISVKAGGTGINLTRANHVVHVDRWWNPAVEAQATDRAHRIGQTRTVLVHTLVTAGTLEERIDRMLQEKAELARLAVSKGERWLTELDDDALRELLALDPAAAAAGDGEAP